MSLRDVSKQIILDGPRTAQKLLPHTYGDSAVLLRLGCGLLMDSITCIVTQ
jgi:hypothetical protein